MNDLMNVLVNERIEKQLNEFEYDGEHTGWKHVQDKKCFKNFKLFKQEKIRNKTAKYKQC